MVGLIIASIGMLLVSAEAQHSSESSEDAACAECMHMSYELRNIPDFYRSILDPMFASLMNPACESNTVEPQTCEALQFPAWMEHKCLTTKVTLSAVNLMGILPAAEMDVTVIVRGCHTQWKGEQGGCINLSELDADTQAQLTQQLSSLSAQWETVTYNGEVCVESP